MAKRLLAHVALCVVLLVAASINMASACSCMMLHPQTHYCLADFGKNTKSLQCNMIVTLLPLIFVEQTYVVGSKSFRPDIKKPCQMENAVRDT